MELIERISMMLLFWMAILFVIHMSFTYASPLLQ